MNSIVQASPMMTSSYRVAAPSPENKMRSDGDNFALDPPAALFGSHSPHYYGGRTKWKQKLG